jgi:hypothetical protein
LVMANCLVDYAMFHVLLSLEKFPLSWDFLHDSFLTNFSRFCETSGLNKLFSGYHVSV